MISTEGSLPMSDNKEKSNMFNLHFSSQATVNNTNIDLPPLNRNINQNILSEIIISPQDVVDALENLNI
jgi:hypothetical protein